jgi:dCMP deaminase
MVRLSHDQYFLQLLNLVALRSTCVRRAVGAIIVSYEHQVLSTGYNGVPRHLNHCDESPCAGADDPSGDTRRCEAVHAEVNAVLQCHRLDLAHTMYVSCAPCFECAKMICNTPIQRVVSLTDYPGEGKLMLARARISAEVYDTTVDPSRS